MRNKKPKSNRKKRLNKSLIPNLVTMLNMFLGFLAVIFITDGKPVEAGWLILLAAFFDSIDGKIARLIGITSKFGIEFDSFADTISFCLAPTILIYTQYIHGLPPLLGAGLSFIPLLFGTIRLSKFNLAQVDSPKSFFIGLTTPLNALIIFGFMLFNQQVYGNSGDPRTALVIVVICGFLMLSPVRFSKLPLITFRKGALNNIKLGALFVIMISAIFVKGLIIFPALLIYSTWNILDWLIHPNRLENPHVVSSTTEE